jgi:hypothetical protein
MTHQNKFKIANPTRFHNSETYYQGDRPVPQQQFKASIKRLKNTKCSVHKKIIMHKKV